MILTFCNIVCCPFRHLSSSSSKIEIYMVIFDSGFLFSSWVKNQIYKAFITTVKSILPTWKNVNFIGIFSTSYRKVTFSLTDTQKPISICNCSIMTWSYGYLPISSLRCWILQFFIMAKMKSKSCNESCSYIFLCPPKLKVVRWLCVT